MKDILRMALVLGLVCIASALGLSKVYDLTKEPIKEALKQEFIDALNMVLPPFDNVPDEKAVEEKYFVATKAGQKVGTAFSVETMEGYSGFIQGLVGVDNTQKVTGVAILTHAETPGLGAKFTNPDFLAQFKGKTLESTKWLVKKDGGEFDAITGATITPRALVGAIKAGLTNLKSGGAK
jgi:electron transport complex protein RnfG